MESVPKADNLASRESMRVEVGGASASVCSFSKSFVDIFLRANAFLFVVFSIVTLDQDNISAIQNVMAPLNDSLSFTVVIDVL